MAIQYASTSREIAHSGKPSKGPGSTSTEPRTIEATIVWTPFQALVAKREGTARKVSENMVNTP